MADLNLQEFKPFHGPARPPAAIVDGPGMPGP